MTLKEKQETISAIPFQGITDSKGQMWDLFWRKKQPFVIPFNKSEPKTKVKDIEDIKLKNNVLSVLKELNND